jgi:5-methylcytosine-specific restriction endonuclease McrA
VSTTSRRPSISKRLRFEVLKRDQFRCQYCGAQAVETPLVVQPASDMIDEISAAGADSDTPPVRLHVDHVVARAKGGLDHIANYVTACEACNLGKGARALDDHTAVRLQHNEVARRAAHVEQLQLVARYHREIMQAETDEASVAVDAFNAALDEYDITLNATGAKSIKKIVTKYGLPETLEAIRIAVSQYLDGADVGVETVDHALKKLGGICHVRRLEQIDPQRAELFRIRGILFTKFGRRVYADEALSILEDAAEIWVLDFLRSLAREARSYSTWRHLMLDLLAVDAKEASAAAAEASAPSTQSAPLAAPLNGLTHGAAAEVTAMPMEDDLSWLTSGTDDFPVSSNERVALPWETEPEVPDAPPSDPGPPLTRNDWDLAELSDHELARRERECASDIREPREDASEQPDDWRAEEGVVPEFETAGPQNGMPVAANPGQELEAEIVVNLRSLVPDDWDIPEARTARVLSVVARWMIDAARAGTTHASLPLDRWHRLFRIAGYYAQERLTRLSLDDCRPALDMAPTDFIRACWATDVVTTAWVAWLPSLQPCDIEQEAVARDNVIRWLLYQRFVEETTGSTATTSMSSSVTPTPMRSYHSTNAVADSSGISHSTSRSRLTRKAVTRIRLSCCLMSLAYSCTRRRRRICCDFLSHYPIRSSTRRTHRL